MNSSGTPELDWVDSNPLLKAMTLNAFEDLARREGWEVVSETMGQVTHLMLGSHPSLWPNAAFGP